MSKITTDIIKDRVAKAHGDRVSVLDEYTSSAQKMTFRCNICGNEWRAVPSSVTKGHGCPKCASRKISLQRSATENSVVEKIKNTHGDNIYMIGEYKNASSYALFHCNRCGKEWRATPQSIIGGNGCKECSNKLTSKRLTYSKETADIKIKEVHGDSIKIIGDYISFSKKAKFHCNECGYEWYTAPVGVKRGTGCPKCGVKRQIEKQSISYEEVVNRLKKTHGDRVTLLSEYNGIARKALFRCNECGNEWRATVNNVVSNGQGCPICGMKRAHDSRRYSQEEAHNKVFEIHKGTIEMIGEYTNSQTHTQFHCNKCGETWTAKPNNIFNGGGCPRCSYENRGKKHRMPLEEVEKKVKEIHGDSIYMIGEYKTFNHKTTFKCKKCGNIWESKPSNTINLGRGCPKCSMSKGEDRIDRWLRKHLPNSEWETQKRYENCIGTGGRPLPFDFYVKSKNLCIEYQGAQHYIPRDYFGGQEYFEIRQEHDSRKRQYCIDNGITLLEIPYTDYDKIEEILDKALKS